MDEGTRPSCQPEKNPAPRGEEDGRMMSAERDSEIYFYIVSSSGWVPPHCAWGYYGKLIKKPHEIICMPHKQHNNGWHQGNGTVYLLLEWWVCTSLLDQGVGLCTALSVVARFQICVRLLWRSCCNYYSSINTSDWPVGSKKLHITHHGIETTWLKLEKDGLSPHILSSWCQHIP